MPANIRQAEIIQVVVGRGYTNRQLLEKAGCTTKEKVISKCNRWTRRFTWLRKIFPWKYTRRDYYVGYPEGLEAGRVRPADERELLVYALVVGLKNLPPEGLRAQGGTGTIKQNGETFEVCALIEDGCFRYSDARTEMLMIHRTFAPRDLWVKE